MPRATWNGFLRLSLVSCPIYLTPATSEGANIRLHQLNPKTGNRVRQQLVDAETGDQVERSDIVRGYEYERHQYVVIPDDELQALRIESSQTIDLDRFVKRDEIDPLYLDTPYYVYPDGKIAIETFRVIGEAMEESGRVGIGHIVLSSRERLVLVEPHGGGMLMRTLRSTNEVRQPEFGDADDHADPDMVAVAKTIIERHGRRVRSRRIPRPLSGRAAPARRKQGRGSARDTQTGRRAAKGHQPDGGAEAQPRRGRWKGAGIQAQGWRRSPAGSHALAGRGRQGDSLRESA